MAKAILLSEIGKFLNIKLQGADKKIVACNSLDKASAEELSFLANPKYLQLLESSKAAAIILNPAQAEKVTNSETSLLISSNPHEDFAKVLALFAKKQGEKVQGLSPLAFIDESVELAENCTVFPFAFIGEKTKLGKNCRIFSGVYIGENCVLGDNCILYPNVVLMAGTVLGSDCTIQPGAVLGADGFGFVRTDHGVFKINQIGTVELADKVEVGANTCIDCAALDKTKIGTGTCIDNLVQIGHNVQVGKECLIISQNGIAGSTIIGDRVTSAGQVGMAGHIHIGDDVVIGPQSGVTKSVESGKTVGGSPIVDHVTYLKTMTLMPRFPEIFKRLSKIEKVLGLKENKE